MDQNKMLARQAAAAFERGQMGEVLRLACAIEAATGMPPRPAPCVPVMPIEDLAPEDRCEPGVYRSVSAIDKHVIGAMADVLDGRRPWPVYLWGPVGTGKSCAALALCDLTRGRYWSMDVIVDQLFDGYRGTGSGATNLWGDVARPTLAVLDEIGARAVSDTVYGAVKHFWESRVRAGNVAIYVSNLSPDGLAQAFDDRIASRLTCGTVVELAGRDRRLDQ